ncbi:reverse rubrerythrin-2 [bacterium BMS3Abin05]|nr:reverse rubrerythrin-2 [bacterium BMS3Abin05]GBE28247.1 reverse rubrerythrin-2 [bacterium BMS3Bbin03]HDK35316.1 rubredoxin [Bacteroidota bacterium]HDZ11231.1 rubredoxin [Bacteroidota bacterium]
MKLWKCSVCGYIADEEAPEVCPKCGAPREKFEAIEAGNAQKIEGARYTNSLHQELFSILSNALDVAEEGIEDNLDPGCLDIFRKAKTHATELRQMVLAEIQIHVNKGKWG